MYKIFNDCDLIFSFSFLKSSITYQTILKNYKILKFENKCIYKGNNCTYEYYIDDFKTFTLVLQKY